MLIDRIWARQAPGKWFCLSTKTRSGKWRDHFFKAADFKSIPQFLKDHRDRQIYFCPHGFRKDERLKTVAEMPKLLWSDLDEADPRTIKLKPTVAIESSPGRYVGLWFTDEPVTEELNRRMSYYVGADRSGWDLTQVLRVPGTINWKYSSTPKVRILWTDGPVYKVKDLDRKLPREDVDDNGGDTGSESDAAQLFKEYQRKLPAWCRRELLAGKPVQGKQSEMIWKLGNSLIEAGIPTDEAFILLKASPWNKFAGRRNEDQQLQRELDKAVNKHLKSNGKRRRVVDDDDEDGDQPRLIFRSMDEVEEEDIDWVWQSRLARGELAILEGDPGLGKSYLMQMIAAHIADGKKLPCDIPGQRAVQGKVLYFDIENSSGTVTKKRLSWNKLEHMENYIQCEEPFSIADDDALDEVYAYAERVRPILLVFDTINTYLGGADAFKGHEIAQSLGRFKEIAQRFNCAVVVLRHLTKSSKERAIYRGQGSIQFTGTARVVLTAGVHPEDPDQRVLAVSKINIGPMPKAMTFSIDPMPGVKDPYKSVFTWGEFVDLTADDIVGAPEKEKNSDKEDAMKFLEDQLDEGAVESSKLEKMAESRGISPRTLQRAADQLGVIKKSKGFGKDKRSFWALTPGEAKEA